MSYPVRYILINPGAEAVRWSRLILPAVHATNKAAIVGAVDQDPDALRALQQNLGVPAEHCFTDPTEAFERRQADFALILAPSGDHEKLIDLCLIYDLHVLVDAPLADTMPAACRIYRNVRDSDKNLAVLSGMRFDQDKQSLARAVRGNACGRLNYLVARSTHNFRKRGTWGRQRHEMDDPVILEDGVHHFDVFRAISEANPKIVKAVSWNPHWGEFRGDSTAFVIFEMDNGVHCLYEGAAANASTMNGMGNEYIRAECELATLILDHRCIALLRGESNEEPRIADIPLAEQPLWGDAWAIEQFCDYCEGRGKPPHRLKEHWQTTAMAFAAVEAAHSGKEVDVQEFIKRQFAETREGSSSPDDL